MVGKSKTKPQKRNWRGKASLLPVRLRRRGAGAHMGSWRAHLSVLGLGRLVTPEKKKSEESII